ncbi:MAG: DUF4394 domain-containing protein [Flavobacteriales bacterium]
MKKKLLLSVVIGALSLTFHSAKAQNIYGLSGSNLVLFNASDPGTIIQNTPISGVPEDLEISGIDFRPATGELFAVGYNQMNGATQLFVIDKATAEATMIGASPLMLEAGLGSITFDFNPTVDRIRFMGSSGVNYRLNPITGGLAATDGSLAFAGTDANSGQMAHVITSAYTNSFIGTTSTALYNFDSQLQVLTLQSPPNAGTLNTVGAVGGMLNIGDMDNGDMEIYFNTMTQTNHAFFVGMMAEANFETLYELDLNSGMLMSIGNLPMGLMIDAIASEIELVDSNIQGQKVFAITSNNYLIEFDSANPEHVISHKAVSGFASGHVISGLDVRPATGELYAIGYNNTSGEAQLYVINPASGAAMPIGDGPIMLSAGMERISFDFNPTVDRIRVLGLNNLNYRLHPETGAIAFNDISLEFAAGDPNFGTDPSIGACAYTNSFSGTMNTTLYNYDDALNIITSQIPPNNGVLNTIGSSGIMLNAANPTADMDIYYSLSEEMNWAFLSANVMDSNFDGFYSIDLMSGATELIGMIGYGIAVNDIAIAIDMLDTEAPVVMCPEDQMINPTSNCMVALPDYTSMAMATDNMDDMLEWSQSPAAGTMVEGNVMVTISAMDDAGNIGSCMFEVDVIDMEMPTIMCPADIMQANVLGANTVYVNIPTPMVMDNCGMAMITNSFNSMENASGFYPTGNTEVIFTAVDANGNSSMCSFMVMVEANTIADGDLIYGVTADNMLIAFGSNNPSELLIQQPITGLMEGFAWEGLDSRPATGELYALAWNNMTQMAQLYVINPANGEASAVGSQTMLMFDNDEIGFDFNPTVDRIRVIGSNDRNYRLHPVTGALAATDGMLAYASGDMNEGADPMVGTCAYTNSFNGSTSTTLYDLDYANGNLVSQIPPNDGVLNTIGSFGISVDSNDPSVEIDIYYDLASQMNRAYIAANSASNSNDMFYSLDLATGMTMEIGMIGDGLMVKDIASAILEVAVGVDEFAQENQLVNIYPNPATDVLNISMVSDQAGMVNLTLVDVTGKIVKSINQIQILSGSNMKQLNVSDLAPGIYFANINLEGQVIYSEKVIVK